MEGGLPLGLASDHAGFALKQHVKAYLDQKGIAYHDYGTYSSESCNYPDFGHALARGMEAGECEKGIAFAEKTQAQSPIVDKWNDYMQDVLDLEMDPETGAQPKLKMMFKME